MLRELHIENVAVIRSIDITFNDGFTVFSGQTGAGKSIIVNSLKMLLGDKPNKDMIRSGEEKAVVSALFTDIDEKTAEKLNELGAGVEDGELYITREVTTAGKSTAKCGKKTVAVYMLREITSLLVNIHGQHSSQTLLNDENHLSYLDNYCECEKELSEYKKYYSKVAELKKELLRVMGDENEKLRRADYLKEQIQEIDSAKLKTDEEEKLLSDREKIKNADKLAKHVKTVYKALSASEKTPPATSLIELAEESLHAISALIGDEGAEENAKKLAQIKYELEDISSSVKDYIAGFEENPKDALDRIESRLVLIGTLKRKYGSDISEILEYRAKIFSELEEIKGSKDRETEIKKEISAIKPMFEESAKTLTAVRKKGGEKLSGLIEEKLRYLDMKNVKFVVDIKTENKYLPTGADVVKFLISSNAGESPKPLSEVASGGELSRTMLALKSVFREKDNIGTVLYDEIDTGISGATSEKIGIMLSQSATMCQVVAITHSAQIASCADNHYLIYKKEYDGRDETAIKMLDYDGAIDEVSRIMGGETITEATRGAAKELIDKNRRIKK